MDKKNQEQFWAGKFGDDYIERNRSGKILQIKTGIFKKILSSVKTLDSVLELGCNIGLNLRAIQKLRPGTRLLGVEINKKAVDIARRHDSLEIYHQSIIDFEPPVQCDLVFTAGVLIHMPEKFLPGIYKTLFEASQKYILVCEYYNPTPVEIPYRGHKERLFKRDFAGEILDRYPMLTLKDYGFFYHRDRDFPADDVTWFLIQKV